MSLFLAACFMVIVHVVVPLPSQIIAHYRMQRYALPPVGETFVLNSEGRRRLTPIHVSGDVVVEWHDSTVPHPTPFKRGVGCDRLCKTLLYREGVTTVTMSNIVPLSSAELLSGAPGRAISSATFRRKSAAECKTIAHPNKVESSDRDAWEQLRNRCYQRAAAASGPEFVIRHGLWSINQPVTGLPHPVNLREAAERNEFILEFQEVRRSSGKLTYRRFCAEVHPIAPVLFIRRTNYVERGVGFEVERQRLTTEWPCGTFDFDF